jgi:prepilin-type N-terminal cleavage/methylation domain-containing protein
VRGFSLIEVLVATAILAGAAVALAGVLTRSLPVTVAAGHVSRATIFASQKIEQLRAAAAIQPSVEFLSDQGTVLGTSTIDGAVPRGAIYVRRLSVAPLPASTIGARVVTITVETLSDGAERAVTTVGVIGAP